MLPFLHDMFEDSNALCRMCDGSTKSEMVSFPVHRIRFCARGRLDSAERECFALSFTQKNATATDAAIHQCHVFRCQVPEAVSLILSYTYCNIFLHSNDSYAIIRNDEKHSNEIKSMKLFQFKLSE